MVVNCELEKVMYNEIIEIMRARYDNIQGVTELWKILKISAGKSGKSLL